MPFSYSVDLHFDYGDWSWLGQKEKLYSPGPICALSRL